MIETPWLATRRFIPRPLTRRCARPASQLCWPGADRWWSRGPFDSEQELAECLVPAPGAWLGGRSRVVAGSDTDLAIGRLATIDRGDVVSELAYLVVWERQGEGIAGEALTGLINHLIASEGRRRLFADVRPDNAASNCLVERLGFTLEGRLGEALTTHIGPRDLLIWGLLAREWPGMPGR